MSRRGGRRPRMQPTFPDPMATLPLRFPTTRTPTQPSTGVDSPRPRALYLMEPRFLNLVYGREARVRLEHCLEFSLPPQTKAGHQDLTAEQRAGIELIITSWDMPVLTPEFLALYPRLKAVFFGAGSVRRIVTPASWQRGVRLISAAHANALPVAEFAFAHIILGLKRVWPQAAAARSQRRFVRTGAVPAGTYGTTVGLLALGHVGRLVARRLQSLDVKVLGYDPFVSAADMVELGVHPAGLDELFARSQVVSCHLPHLPETESFIRGTHFESMPPDAVFINTARGEVVAETEMLDVLRRRTDLFAVIDVTSPEPPRTESPLFDLPNVLLTPHIAGSLGAECLRLGDSIAADVERYVRGESIANEVFERDMARHA